MAYTLKVICYFVKVPNRDCDIGGAVKLSIKNAFFTNSSLVKEINIIKNSLHVSEEKEFISWVECELIFFEDKEKVINRMKILNMQTFLEKMKNEVKFNGDSDYLSLFIGAL